MTILGPDGVVLSEQPQKIQIGVTSNSEHVIVSFGMKVSWLTLTPEDAIGLANMMIKHAQDVIKTHAN